MIKFVFPEIKYKDTVHVSCHICGKKLKRVVSEQQTMNPFNKNPQGYPKTMDEIVVEVRASLKKKVLTLQQKKVYCKTCDGVAL